MKLVIAFAILVAVFFTGFYWLTRKGAGEKQIETMKAVLWFGMVNGCGWVWCSYLLAYLGREQIAESLSGKAVTEIISLVIAYAAKALVEQLSKNNLWPDKPAKKKEDDNIGLSG